MSKTLNIIGAGYTLTELPYDYRFTQDTMALNVSTVAPWFYDWQAEKFHTSWTYAMFIDGAVRNKYFFPEWYYYRKSIENEGGKTYLTNRFLGYVPDECEKNVEWMLGIPKYKTVMLPAMIKGRELGYDRIVLFGCDMCRQTCGRRYWWEDYAPITEHAGNAKAMVSARPDKYAPTTQGHWHVHTRTNRDEEHAEHADTAGNTVLVSAYYTRQRGIIEGLAGELQKGGVEVVKFGAGGMLNIPVITLDKL